jgi:hypothetical protein
MKQERTESETQATPDKNVNKENNGNNDTSQYSKNFEIFWKEYPNKKGKLKAFSSWKKYKCENGDFEKIMKSLGEQKKSRDWTKEDGKYIPNGATWVFGKRWEDEITPSLNKSCDRCTYKVTDKMECWKENRVDCKSFNEVNK